MEAQDKFNVLDTAPLVSVEINFMVGIRIMWLVIQRFTTMTNHHLSVVMNLDEAQKLYVDLGVAIDRMSQIVIRDAEREMKTSEPNT